MKDAPGKHKGSAGPAVWALRAIKWVFLWLLLALAICWAGAVSGGLLFPVAGLLLRMDLPVREMVLNGLLDGGFLALIWAPGLSFVVCLMWGHGKGRPVTRQGR